MLNRVWGVTKVVIMIYAQRRVAEVRVTVVLMLLLIMGSGFFNTYRNDRKSKESDLNDYIQNYEQMIDQIRKRQHDFDNHITAIFSMHILTHDYDELVRRQSEYCEQLIADNKFNKFPVKGSSPVIIGFLFSKISELEERNIKVLHHIVIDEARCLMKTCEIVSVLGNLIDNAADAVKEVDTDKRVIKISLTETEDTLNICVENVSKYISAEESSKFFSKGFSSKGRERGMGLCNVAEIVRKTKSKIIVENRTFENSNWFCIDIAIDKM